MSDLGLKVMLCALVVGLAVGVLLPKPKRMDMLLNGVHPIAQIEGTVSTGGGGGGGRLIMFAPTSASVCTSYEVTEE